jgi:hypothetical protein
MAERTKRTRINEYPIGRVATEGYAARAAQTARDEKNKDTPKRSP